MTEGPAASSKVTAACSCFALRDAGMGFTCRGAGDGRGIGGGDVDDPCTTVEVASAAGTVVLTATGGAAMSMAGMEVAAVAGATVAGMAAAAMTGVEAAAGAGSIVDTSL